jgi:hypothetical protein
MRIKAFRRIFHQTGIFCDEITMQLRPEPIEQLVRANPLQNRIESRGFTL